MALDISKPFDKVWNAGLLPKLKGYGVSCRIFDNPIALNIYCNEDRFEWPLF